MYKEDLDKGMTQGCSTAGCQCGSSQMFMHQACHPKQGLDAMYDSKTGRILLMCRVCQKPIFDVDVAQRPVAA